MGDGTHNNTNLVTLNAATVEAYRASPVSGPGYYEPLYDPVRVVDTRTGVGGVIGTFGVGTIREYPLATPLMGVGATAVAVTVTAISGPDAGYIQANNTPPGSSTPPILNFGASEVRAQTTIVPVTTYKTSFFRSSAPNVHLVVDVVGYVGGEDHQYFPLTDPQRAVNPTFVAAGSHTQISVASLCPTTGVTAVAVNIASFASSSNGYFQAKTFNWQPTTTWSTVNYMAGENVANMAVVRLSGGSFYIYSSAQSGIVVDLLGCYSQNGGGLRYLPFATPVRQLNSQPMGSGAIVDVATGVTPGRPALVRATGVNGPSGTYLTMYSSARPLPATSNVNLMPNGVNGNSAIVPTNGSGWVRIYRGAHPDSTNVFLDVFGQFVP